MRPIVFSTFLGLLAFSAPAFAQPAVSLADLGQDARLTAAFDTMAEGHEIPDWVRNGAVTSAAGHAGFGGQEYLVLTGCKQHECATNQIALLYQPESGAMFGLLATGDQTGEQQLTWLNIGGNAESIDGRTVLFAATTGSLDNHPDAFDYREAGTKAEASPIDAAAPVAAPAEAMTVKPTAKPAGKATTHPEPKPTAK